MKMLLDELNDKSTDVLNDFYSEELQTLNHSQPVDIRACGPVFLKELPCITAPHNTFSLLKNVKHEAPVPHHRAIEKKQVKNHQRVYLLEHFERY